ncbi:MAG: putative toxin-antitoxin system toxin component, PIN family [Anaerolineae bacterium]|nr:putative toxin-antitoxin system toxin component, PIN family [Anaerolineae bacterium]
MCRDPDDNHILACAVAGQAILIVSGDSDLLDLGEYRGVRIMTAAQFVTMMETADSGEGRS